MLIRLSGNKAEQNGCWLLVKTLKVPEVGRADRRIPDAQIGQQPPTNVNRVNIIRFVPRTRADADKTPTRHHPPARRDPS